MIWLSIQERRSKLERIARAAKAGQIGGRNYPKVSLSDNVSDKLTSPSPDASKPRTRAAVAEEATLPAHRPTEKSTQICVLSQDGPGSIGNNLLVHVGCSVAFQASMTLSPVHDMHRTVTPRRVARPGVSIASETVVLPLFVRRIG
jgi:hypothetical protein